MQFNAELNNTNARLAEEVEASADMVARSEKADRSMVEMALGLSVAVKACTAQKSARSLLKLKLEQKQSHSAKMERQRDVANLQVCCSQNTINKLASKAYYAPSIVLCLHAAHTTARCGWQRWLAQAYGLTGNTVP